MRILILDDDDIRHEAFKWKLAGRHDCVHVHTVDEAVHALANHAVYDIAFLDHDLNDHQYSSIKSVSFSKIGLTGYDVASYIARELAPAQRPKTVVVHSWNTPGGDSMMMVLREAGIRALRWFFDSTFKDVNII